MARGMRVCAVAALVSMTSLTGNAGDVAIEVIVTKRLTKRALTAPVYNLRGKVPQAIPEPENTSEFDKTIVMLEGGKVSPLAPQTVTIEQRGGRFEPGLVVVPVGSTVNFPNFDPIFHNVFSLSRAQSFDLGFYPKDHTKTVKFSRAGIVQVYCHIHASMYAAIVVTASPWFAKPGADGIAAFPDVPAGHYKVVAWHKVAGVHQTEIEVTATGQSRAKIRVPIDTEPGM